MPGVLDRKEIVPGALMCRVDAFLDDRGKLFEMVREDWPELGGVHFRQVYVISNWQPGTVRAWHLHRKLVDIFCVASGAAMFGVCPHAEENGVWKPVTEPKTCILEASPPTLLVVQPGVAHGWKSLRDGTILLSVASELYNREHPDEVRFAWDALGKEIWETRPR